MKMRKCSSIIWTPYCSVGGSASGILVPLSTSCQAERQADLICRLLRCSRRSKWCPEVQLCLEFCAQSAVNLGVKQVHTAGWPYRDTHSAVSHFDWWHMSDRIVPSSQQSHASQCIRNASPPAQANNATRAANSNPPTRALYMHLIRTPHTHHTAPCATKVSGTDKLARPPPQSQQEPAQRTHN